MARSLPLGGGSSSRVYRRQLRPRLPDVSPGPVAALGEGQEPEAPAVKREAEEDWGR
jgi:hypothetical protein